MGVRLCAICSATLASGGSLSAYIRTRLFSAELVLVLFLPHLRALGCTSRSSKPLRWYVTHDSVCIRLISPFALPGSSPLENVPSQLLLSKISSIRPPPVSLIPDVLSTSSEGLHLSACVWIVDEDLDMLPAWAARWAGESSVRCPCAPSHTSRPR